MTRADVSLRCHVSCPRGLSIMSKAVYLWDFKPSIDDLPNDSQQNIIQFSTLADQNVQSLNFVASLFKIWRSLGDAADET